MKHSAKATDDFYNSQRWQHLRESIMRRDKYTCQLSLRYGKHKPAQVVHHIFPRDEYPQYQYSPWNLISITTAMHMTLHDRTNNELTENGIELLKRTARKNKIELPERYR